MDRPVNGTSQPPNPDSEKRPAAYSSGPFWIVLVVGILVSAVAWQIAVQNEERVAAAMFQVDAREQSLVIRRELQTASSALEDLASMYAVANVVTGEQFKRFVAPILARNPALKALGWNPLVTHAEREAYERALRESGFPGYRITERSPDGQIRAASRRDEYVVVAAIEPLEGNESARGYDVASETTRRMALERARDTGSLAIAAPIVLVQMPGESRSALGFLPRYRGAVTPATIAERRASLAGFLVVVVDISRTIAAALSNLSAEGIVLRIVTTPPGGTAAELYVSENFPQQAGATGTSAFSDALQLQHSTGFAWGGHKLDLQFVATDAYNAAGRTWVPWGILLATLALTLLTATMVHLLRGRTLRIAREVAERTRELRETNRELEAEVLRRKEVEKRFEAHQQDLEREVAARTSELKATTTQLRTILDSEPECVKIVSADGQLEDMNAAGLAMIEADSLEAVRGCSVYSLVTEEYRDAFIELNRRVIAGEPGTLQFRLKGLRGGERWVDTSAVPLADPDSGTIRHLAITRDITAKKAAEEEQARLEGQFRQTQKLESIGIMAGGIAHDFNNLLQVIIGNSEIALDEFGENDRARSAIEVSQFAAIEAAKLCDQMLTYAGRSRPAIQSIHLPNLVGSIINLLGVSRSKKAEFELDVDDTVDTIEGDDAQLSQVVMNLVTNASEAIGDEPGRVVVSIRTVDVPADVTDDRWVGSPPPPGRYVSLDVSDSGSGMDAETQERMFDPFFTTKFAGRGLGLSATLGIIQSHSGFIQVASDAGRGTHITVLFPVASSARPQKPASVEHPAVFDQTVLLVDDEAVVRNVGRSLLEKLGCHVVPAAAGEQAVSYFAEHADTIDVVLLDVTMPGMDGNETCAELRRIRPDVSIIFCSGYAEDAVQQGADSAGYTGFLHKPYRLEDLAAALREAIEHQVPELSI